MGISACILSHRGLIKVSGPDRQAFLQGLITNDVTKVVPDRAIYALLLSPQGRIQFDLLIHQSGDDLYLETDACHLEILIKRLTIFKLRSQVTLDIVADKIVMCLWGENVAQHLGLPQELGACASTSLWTSFLDPRLLSLGARLIIPKDSADKAKDCLGFNIVESDAYREFRYKLGVPESADELEFDRAIPLEYGMDELQAIDWIKGCYMGQELTARTKYRGLIRKRLFPVTFLNMNPDNPFMSQDKEVGHLIAQAGDRGLAMIRLEALTNEITCGGQLVHVNQPSWMKLPKTDD